MESEEPPNKEQDEKGESSDSSVFSDGESIFRTSFVTISQYRLAPFHFNIISEFNVSISAFLDFRK